MYGAGFEAIASRRPAARSPASLLSLVLHGGALVLLVVVVGRRHHDEPRPSSAELIAIEVDDPHAAALAALAARPGTLVRAPGHDSAGARGARGQDLPKARRSVAELGDVVVSYDDGLAPASGAPDGTDGVRHGTGLVGLGRGAGGDGPYGNGTGLAIPAPPPGGPSKAREARPATDYSRWTESDGGQFAGEWVKVELSIDPGGHVASVRVLKHVDPDIDRHAIDTVRRFEFEPALDRDGNPIWSLYHWELEVRADFHRRPLGPKAKATGTYVWD